MGKAKDEIELYPLTELMATVDDALHPQNIIIQDNVENRRIVVNNPIDGMSFEEIGMWIMYYNKQDKYLPVDKRKPIYLYIDSPGGDPIEGTQLISFICCSKTPIYTIGFARCASMAFYLLLAGHKRYCFANTIGLYHDGQMSVQGSSNKVKDTQRFYEKIDDHLVDFTISHTKMDKEFLNSIADREYYMFPEEMKERGVVDAIIGVDVDMEDIL